VKEQENFTSLIQHLPHIQIRYEDFVPEDSTVSVLNDVLTDQLLKFIGLEKEGALTTAYIKTGVVVS
jgi:hypothetical protein